MPIIRVVLQFRPIEKKIEQTRQECIIVPHIHGDKFVGNKNTRNLGRDKYSTIRSLAPCKGRLNIRITRAHGKRKKVSTAFSSLPVQTGLWEKNSCQPCAQIRPPCIAEGQTLRHDFHKYYTCPPIKKIVALQGRHTTSNSCKAVNFGFFLFP